MTHTLNGEPILPCGHTETHHKEKGGTVWCITALASSISADLDDLAFGRVTDQPPAVLDSKAIDEILRDYEGSL